jgi:hypothetical protein
MSCLPRSWTTAPVYRPQLQPQLRGQCLKLAIAQGRAGEWDVCLGALRLSRALGATARGLSAADNGSAALLFAESVGRLLLPAGGAA